MSTTIPDWLAHRADSLPDAPALTLPDGRRLTFRELDDGARGLASALIAGGVEPGERVAVLASNSLEMVESVHAVPRAGAILVLLNGRLTAAELAWQLQRSGARLLLAHGPTLPLATAAAAEAGLPPPLALPHAAGPRAALRDAHRLDDTHSIIFTSGTTGRPKGAMLTFGNFWASASASAFNLGVSPEDRWLACMPLFHVGGLSIILRSAIAGTEVVVHAGFDEAAVNRALHDVGITHVSVVPTMLQRLIDHDPRPAPPGLRVVLTGGGPLPLPILERALDLGYPVLQTYGLTEAASQVATLAPRDAVRRAGSAGKPLVSTRLRIDAPPGEPGEILVSGPTVSPGYWDDPEATARAIRGGWLHTGDIGRLDDDGFLFVMDRRDDLIVSGGENVYPAEVESALLALPGVVEAAVVGLPDERWGQIVAAAVVAGPAFDEAAALAAIRQRLAGYKAPRRLQVVAELPKTVNGKVQRRIVREMLA